MSKKTRTRMLQILSWMVVTAIFLYVFASIVPKEQAVGLGFWGKIEMAFTMVSSALAKANTGLALLTCAAYCLHLLFFDSLSTAWVISRFNTPLKLRQILPARAVTFLIAVLNYQAGQLALPLYLKKVHKIPAMEATSSIVFIAAMDLFIVLTLAFIGSLFISQEPFSKQILVFSAVGMVGYIGIAMFWRFEAASKPLLKILQKIPVVGPKLFHERSLFLAFQKAHFKDYFGTFFLRAPISLGIFFSIYFLILCFGENVPLMRVLVYFPVIMISGLIPVINVGGVGATQALVVYFFKSHASEANLLAVTLIWALSINAFKVALGAFFLSRTSKDLFYETEPAAA